MTTEMETFTGQAAQARYCIQKMVFILAVLANVNTLAQENEETGELWTPSDGRSRDEWLLNHGQSAEALQRVKQKLFELKMTELAVDAPAYDIDEDAQSALLDQDRLDSCIWLTEDQVDLMLQDQPETYEDMANSFWDGRRRRRKRKIEDFVARPSRKWSTMPIRYKFDGKHSRSEKKIIRGAFSHWMEQTCVEFEELAMDAELKDNHILVTKQPTGCHSYPGQVDIIPQQLNLQQSCLTEFGTPVHEIGHALGLWHEQQRSDRDNHIRVIWTNVLQGYVGQFYKNKKSVTYGVPYDLGSVMHYPPKAGSKNRGNTMESLDPDYQGNIGQKTGLSFLDAKIINLAYCSDKCSGKPLRKPCMREGYQDPKDCRSCICPDGFTGRYCQELDASKHAKCGGEIEVTTTPRTIQSPGYSDPGYYDDHQFCAWHFKTKKDGQSIVFRFEDEFGIYCHNQGTCYHWAELRYKTSIGLQGPRFCCYNTPNATYRGDLGEMLLVFKANFSLPADWTSSRRGFKVVVYAEPRGSGTLVTVATRQTTTTVQTADAPEKSEHSAEEDAEFDWNCSFDTKSRDPTWCDITQDDDDDFDWTLREGNTPSGNTGPAVAFHGTHYIYIEASRRRKNDHATIQLPDIHRRGLHCVSFQYHMHGFHVDKLLLLKRSCSESESVLWQKAKQQGDRWLHASVHVDLNLEDRLAFKGVTDGHYSGDVALDNIYVTSGECDALSDDSPLYSDSTGPTDSDPDTSTVAGGATVQVTWLSTWCVVFLTATHVSRS